MLHWYINLLFTVLSFNLHTSTTRNIHMSLNYTVSIIFKNLQNHFLEVLSFAIPPNLQYENCTDLQTVLSTCVSNQIITRLMVTSLLHEVISNIPIKTISYSTNKFMALKGGLLHIIMTRILYMSKYKEIILIYRRAVLCKQPRPTCKLCLFSCMNGKVISL